MKGIKALKAALIGAMFMIPTLAYGQAYGTVATETLNVREGAKLESPIVKQVGLGEKVEIVHQQDGWLKIILKNDERAYVKAEYINVNRVVALVDVNDGLNVRDYPSTENGKVIGRFETGDEISVLYRVGDWYKVSQEGFEGFVHRDYVKNSSDVDFLSYLPTKKLTQVRRMTMTQEEAMAIMVEAEQAAQAAQEAQEAQNAANNSQSSNKTNSSNSNKKPSSSSSSNKKPSSSSSSNKKPSSSSSSSGSATGQAVVSYAKQFLGNPYVYGGNSLTNGVDCSGFTSQVMRHFGISLNRSSAAQYANNGYHVSRDNLMAGDLLFYGYSGRVSHVAIYIGGGQIIHANDERTGICIGNAFPSRGKPYIGAKRVL